MPITEDIKQYRIWLVKDKKCLVLKKKDSEFTFAFAGEGGREEKSSIVEPVENCEGSNSIGRQLVFRHGEEKYVLDVENDTENDTVVTARKFTEKEPPKDAACFMWKTVVGPFQTCVLKSDERKGMVADNKGLTIRELQGTDSSATTLVICDAHFYKPNS